MKTTLLTGAAVCLLLGLLLGLTTAREHDDASHSAKTETRRDAVVGVVKFDGPRPKRKPIHLTGKDGKPSDCHTLHKNGLLDENLLVGEKGGLANVFVYVKQGLDKKIHPVPAKPALLDQDHCLFRPRVQGVLVGQEFSMRNSDPLVHNVRALSIENRPFNVAQPADTPDRIKVFKKPERAIAIQCDFHPWMKAYVFVMDHPYFAVTDEKGIFEIKGLPAGEYTLAAWHEEFGERELKVVVTAARPTDVSFTFDGKVRKSQPLTSNSTLGSTTSAGPAKASSRRRFVKMWTPADLAEDVKSLENQSPERAERGREIFAAAACSKCHVIAGKGTKLGPDLTEVVKRFQGAKLLEQVLKPSTEIHKDFQTVGFTTDDGKTVVGLVVKEEGDTIHILPNPLKPREVTMIPKSAIERRFKSQLSTMPEGLLMTFKKEEILDLLAFLQAGGKVKD